MFKGIMDTIKEAMKYAKNPPRFDPTVFNNELASQIDWQPAKGGGTNICTHKLKKISSSKVQFVPTFGAIFFYGIFLVIGLLIMTLMTFSMYRQDGLSVELLFPILFGGVFSAVGGTLMYFGTAPITFDKAHNYYIKGRAKVKERSLEKVKGKVDLNQVKAIQILSEYCRSDKSSYTSYELNLVLKDASRLNVVDHGKRSQLIADAETLSSFLGIPIWNKKDAYIYDQKPD